MLCKCGLCHRAVSIYPSVTLVILSKRVIISSDLFTVGYPNHSSFCTPNLMAICRRDPLNGGIECRWVRQKLWFSTNSSLSIDDSCSVNNENIQRNTKCTKMQKKNKVGLAKKQREVPCHFSAHFTFYIIIILARYHLPARRHWDVFMILVQDINIQTYLFTYLLTYLLTYHCQYYNEVVQ